MPLVVAAARQHRSHVCSDVIVACVQICCLSVKIQNTADALIAGFSMFGSRCAQRNEKQQISWTCLCLHNV